MHWEGGLQVLVSRLSSGSSWARYMDMSPTGAVYTPPGRSLRSVSAAPRPDCSPAAEQQTNAPHVGSQHLMQVDITASSTGVSESLAPVCSGITGPRHLPLFALVSRAQDGDNGADNAKSQVIGHEHLSSLLGGSDNLISCSCRAGSSTGSCISRRRTT